MPNRQSNTGARAGTPLLEVRYESILIKARYYVMRLKYCAVRVKSERMNGILAMIKQNDRPECFCLLFGDTLHDKWPRTTLLTPTVPSVYCRRGHLDNECLALLARPLKRITWVQDLFFAIQDCPYFSSKSGTPLGRSGITIMDFNAIVIEYKNVFPALQGHWLPIA